MTNSLIVRVRDALSEIVEPKTGRNIVAAGLVRGLSADQQGNISFTLDFGGDDNPDAASILEQAKAAANIDGVRAVNVVATAHKAKGASKTKDAAPARGHANPFGLKKKSGAAQSKPVLPDVKHVIAVASGKGGVGKSTIAANLAVALARRGLKIGLLDADIYGPSAPTLFGIDRKPAMTDNKIEPIDAFGVRVMSIGLLVDEKTALAWRGPMVMGAVRQLIGDVNWGALDILIIDTPPGTGDTHLSLIQTKRLSGAIIVSTPQTLALADVRRGYALFRKTDTPVIGVIENMAWLEGPDGTRQYVFGEGGARRAAEELGAPFLGEAPLIPDLRVSADAGAPIAASDHPAAEIFRQLAEKIVAFTRR